MPTVILLSCIADRILLRTLLIWAVAVAAGVSLTLVEFLLKCTVVKLKYCDNYTGLLHMVHRGVA